MMTSFILASCSDTTSSKKTTSTSTDNSIGPTTCQQYPYLSECMGSTTGSTTGTTTSGTTTSGSTNGNSTNPNNPNYNPLTDNNWTASYPNGAPAGTCSSPTGAGYDLRRGTITIAGGTMYRPDLPWSNGGSFNFSQTNSYFLMNANEAKAFFDTDSKLRVRFKVRPQPKAPPGVTYCFNRVTGQNSDRYGYMNLMFNVSLIGLNADGTLKSTFESTKSATVGVNSCSQAMDFSGDNQRHPNGVVIVVHNVYSDQGCTYQTGCTSYVPVRSFSCWQMDFEVSADGTKDI